MALGQRKKHVHNVRVENAPPNRQLQDVLFVMERVARPFVTNVAPVMAVEKCSKKTKKHVVFLAFAMSNKNSELLGSLFFMFKLLKRIIGWQVSVYVYTLLSSRSILTNSSVE
jgi:hypothetical protein